MVQTFAIKQNKSGCRKKEHSNQWCTNTKIWNNLTETFSLMDLKFKNQASLLLRILPEIAKEKDFALHGGTAINFFCHDMPRLSVDIDLTYLPFRTREADLSQIRRNLLFIRERLVKTIPNISVKAPVDVDDDMKLYCSIPGALVKVEVNTINRGVIGIPELRTLSLEAQELFKSFCEIQVVTDGQLFGGKICAALDRQHPRDLFDVKKMFENTGYTEKIHHGFLFCLLASNRPIHEIFNPLPINQSQVLKSQFSGMTIEPFTYDDYVVTRTKLIQVINKNLREKDKVFLISFKEGLPDWNIDAFVDFSRFPAIQWKLQNIQKLKQLNPQKHKIRLEALKRVLFQYN